MNDGQTSRTDASAAVHTGALAAGDWAMVAAYSVLLGAVIVATSCRSRVHAILPPSVVSLFRLASLSPSSEPRLRHPATSSPPPPPSSEESGRGGGGVPHSAEAYFLAGRDAPWWAVGLSLFSSNIGSEHLVGLAGSGAKIGLCVSWGEWLSPLCILLLGWVFVPFFLRTRIFTMPEFLERRFSRSLRIYYAVVSLAMYVMTKVSVALFAGAVVLNLTVGWSFWTGATALVLATGAYTSLGGMKAVLYTEVLQGVVLIAGGVCLLTLACMNEYM